MLKSLANTTLLVLTAIAVSAIAASSASAAQVTTESTGGACPAVSNTHHGNGTGGCAIHATSVGKVEFASITGMVLCDFEFEGRLNGNGEGYIYHPAVTNCTGGTVVVCNEAGVPDNWPLELTSETNLETTYCVTMFGFINIACHLAIVTVTQITHSWTWLAATHANKCEGSTSNGFEGTMDLEIDAGHPPIEIID